MTSKFIAVNHAQVVFFNSLHKKINDISFGKKLTIQPQEKFNSFSEPVFVIDNNGIFMFLDIQNKYLDEEPKQLKKKSLFLNKMTRITFGF